MLRLLTDVMDRLKSGDVRGAKERQHTLQLATAVLLIEVVRADGSIDDGEQQAVFAALRSKFDLTADELVDLFSLAHRRSDNTHDLYTFTAQLNETLDEPGRIRVLELLWSVTFADDAADAHESHLLQKLADLLHVRHVDAIGARLRAGESRRR